MNFSFACAYAGAAIALTLPMLAHAISQGDAAKACKAEVAKQPGLQRHVFGKVRVGPERKDHRKVWGIVALGPDRREFRCSVSNEGAVSNIVVMPMGAPPR